jgi:hypothetical protein
VTNPEPPLPGATGPTPLSGQGRSEEAHWKYVLRKLGGGVVDVELTSRGDTDPLTGNPFPAGETHMDDCIADTKRWFAHRVGAKKPVQVMLNNRQSAYLMPPDTIDVVDVIMPRYQLPTLDADQFSFTYFSLLFGQWTNPNVAPMPYSDLVQRLQYLEQIGRIFSTDRDWEYHARTRTLEIYPAPAAVGNFGANSLTATPALVWIWSWEVDPRTLDPQEEDFFRRKLLVEAMKTLANIRAKVDSWQMPGGDRSLNGADLQANAEGLEEQLKTDILNWKRPVPLITG